MDSKIIELLKLKGMGNISSFLLQNYWSVLVTIMVLLVGLLVVLVAMAGADFDIIPIFVLLGVIISIFILFIININTQTPLNNLESTSTNKKIMSTITSKVNSCCASQLSCQVNAISALSSLIQISRIEFSTSHFSTSRAGRIQ